MDKSIYVAFCSFLTKNFPLVNNHPDVAGLLRDPYILQNLGGAMAKPFLNVGITKVIAPEARGPVLGALVATHLKAGLVLVRKGGRNLSNRFRTGAGCGCGIRALCVSTYRVGYDECPVPGSQNQAAQGGAHTGGALR